MSPETLLLDKIEEKGVSPLSKSVEPASEAAVNLKEDTTLPRTPAGELVRQSTFFAEGEAGEVTSGAVRILFEESPVAAPSGTPFRASLDALTDLRSGTMAADWLEVAMVLKRDVARLRDTNYSRHAAVLLALADALTFTEPAEVPVDQGAKPLLSHALGLLSEPYVSEASEEEFLGELLMSGWNLAPSHEQAAELVD